MLLKKLRLNRAMEQSADYSYAWRSQLCEVLLVRAVADLVSRYASCAAR